MASNLIQGCQQGLDSFLRQRLSWLPARIALGVIGWFGFVNMYMVRVNLSVAIIAMAKRNISGGRDAVCIAGSQENVLESPLSKNNETSEWQSFSNNISTTAPHQQVKYQEGEFDWDETTQGLILGAFFYGYLFSQLLGGRLAELYGTKIVYGSGILGSGILALLSPVMAHWHYGALIALRVGQGFFQGPTWPAMHACISRWIPPIERPQFVAIVYLAATLSLAITLPLCGLIIANHGWEAQFYIFGCLSLLWCCLWFGFMYDSPEEHPRISSEELNMIQTALRESGTRKSTSKKVPWKAIFKSAPFWAILIYTIGNNWGINLFFSQLPTYMRNVLGFSIKSNGALSAVPFLCRYFGGIAWSTLGAWLISRKYLSTTNTRRVFSVLGLGAPALMLLGVSFAGCDAKLTVALFCLALICNAAGTTSGFVNHTDIAPNFAGTLMGITSTLGSLIASLVPVVTGVITQGQQTMEAWQKVFWICVPLYLFSMIFYLLLVSGEVQPWNDIDAWEAKKKYKKLHGIKEEQEDEEKEEKVPLKDV